MTTSPRLLLDTSIAQLQTLASFLAVVLIPKLQAARYVVADDAPRFRHCVNCDDA